MKQNKSSAQITSLDENGSRLNLQPAEVQGIYRTYRTYVEIFLIVVFLLTPWTTVKGIQTIYLNIPDREFYFFGTLFRAHNVPIIFFVVFGAAISLALVTSLWGRVWCGWACPQTVFIDGIYRRIEYWIEGNYLARRKMEIDPVTPQWLFKKSLKWISFLFVSSFIAHSFLAYFVGARSFWNIIENGPSSHFTVFILAQVFTLVFLFDFGWFREQFCTIMCPYGRIQGLLLDKNTLGVVYDEKRNDCVNCNRCVSACPIGIDIRNGLQMECIACTACIDACDEIMVKVKKPKGLIRYDTFDGQKINYFKPRTILYGFVVLLCIVGLFWVLHEKMHSEAFLFRAVGAPFSEVKKDNGTDVLNHFKIHIANQDSKTHSYSLKSLDDRFEIVMATPMIQVKSKEFTDWHIFVKQSLDQYQSKQKLKLLLEDSESKKLFHKEFEIEFIGPLKGGSP